MVKQGLSPAEAAARFYVLDHNGLITHQARRSLTLSFFVLCCAVLRFLCAGSPGAHQAPGTACPMLVLRLAAGCLYRLLTALPGPPSLASCSVRAWRRTCSPLPARMETARVGGHAAWADCCRCLKLPGPLPGLPEHLPAGVVARAAAARHLARSSYCLPLPCLPLPACPACPCSAPVCPPPPRAWPAECEAFVEVVRRVKPTALIGLSGAGRLFTPDALK